MRLTILRQCLLLWSILFYQINTWSQQTAQAYIQKTNYLLAMPDGYDKDTAKRWPLLIFLHGSGERGSDVEKVKANGPPRMIEDGKKFPFIVVSPQVPERKRWSPELLYDLINDLQQSYHIDADRIYLTGLSMGGFGTWEMAMKYPHLFAAIAPVCGGGDSSTAWKLRNIPIWNFHGAKDDVVLPESSEKMVTAARRHNPNVKYTLYPEANHNSWDLAYGNDSLYSWLLAQKRFRYQQVDIKPQDLIKYTGTYVNGTDTVRVIAEEAALYALFRGQKIQLRSAGNHLFFIDPSATLDLSFHQNKGAVTGFRLRDDAQQYFKKIK